MVVGITGAVLIMISAAGVVAAGVMIDSTNQYDGQTISNVGIEVGQIRDWYRFDMGVHHTDVFGWSPGD